MSARTFGFIIVATFLPFVAAASAQTTTGQIGSPQVQETRVRSLHPFASDFIATADMKRVAYVSRRAEDYFSNRFIVADGQPGAEYDSVECPVFSPDGKRLVYRVGKHYRDEKRRYVQSLVVDGQAGPEYSYIPETSIVISPDSKRVAYLAETEQEKWVVVVDGQAEEVYDQIIGDVIFSPDSKHVTYVAYKGKKYCVVVDGHAGPDYDFISKEKGSVFFSSDSKHVAYRALEGKVYLTIVDGRKMEADGNQVCTLVFSPDGKRMAYTAKKGDKYHVVVDGLPGAEWDNLGDLIFSPDSKHVAYVAWKGKSVMGSGGTRLVVMDGVEGPEYDFIRNLVFSPDSNRLAYEASRIDSYMYFIVVDGKPGEDYEEIDNAPIFSSDSKRLAYMGKRGKDWFAVVDGREVLRASSASMLFSPDCERVVSVEMAGNDLVIVDQSGTATRYPDIAKCRVIFSHDGKHVAYVLGKGEMRTGELRDGVILHKMEKWVLAGKEYVVVDGKTGPEYEEIINSRFGLEGALEYLAVKDQAMFHVKHTLGR